MRTTTHTIHAHHHHLGWDNANPVALRVDPGATVEFEIVDASGGQLGIESTVEDISQLDFTRINPVTGPVFVEGAEPGDALVIRVLEFAPSSWGWTANIPGFGLLADQFTQPALHLWQTDSASQLPAAFGPGGKVPLKPMIGTIGVALAQAGIHSVVPPRRVGGNMDIRDIGAGTTLILPVEVAGALLSVGDTHAAQGDGEVCGTAIESAMRVAVEVDVIKHAAPKFPRFETDGPVTRHLDAKGYHVTTGVGADLMHGARDSVSGMIELLCAMHALAAVDAYMLCSVCADLRISEIVDQPNWIVSTYFPKVVFD